MKRLVAFGAILALLSASVAGAQIQGGGGGGFQYPESTAHVSGDFGNQLLCVRQDTATALATNGQYVPCIVDANGRSWVTAVQSGIWTIVGSASDNSTTSTAKLPTIVAKATAAAPTWTEGNQVPISVDLNGNTRVKVEDNGLQRRKLISTATTNLTTVKASAGTVFSFTCMNSSTSNDVFVKFYDTASTVTVGTTVPDETWPVPAAPATGVWGGLSPNIGGDGIAFTNAIKFAVTSGAADNDATAVAAEQVICMFQWR